jgi:transposase
MARSKTYPRDVRERAVALVFEQVKTGQHGSQWEVICSVAAKIGVSGETVRKWVRQAEVDAGARPGSTSDESAELKRLRRENHELRRANEILKAASAFFARELDPRLPHS